MSMIQVNNLTFGYEGSLETVFDQVSFQIDTAWKLGFVARNGKGKTTFLKLLLGEYDYSGSIISSAAFDYFPFTIKEKNKMTLEVLYDIMPDLEEWKLMIELSDLCVSTQVLYRPYQTLSNGEQTKVLLGLLFLRENQFLLIDEPTNHLDGLSRQEVCRYLNRKKGFILVSHDREFLDSCTDHTLALNRFDIQVVKGNFSSWWQNKELRDRFELQENEKLKKDVKRLTKAADRTKNWSDQVEKSKFNSKNSGLKVDRGYIGHKSAKMMKRSKSTEQRIEKTKEEKAKLLKNIETNDDLKLIPKQFHKERLLSLKDIVIDYGNGPLMNDFLMEIGQGERIALKGLNGSGKSSILRILLGDEVPHQGEVIIPRELKISYVPQDTSCLSGFLDQFITRKEINETIFKAVLRKLDFNRELFGQPLETYSAGQKKKIFIAASLCESAHLYIWDEPLNYIDIFSRMQIEELILNFSPTLVFVEHDRRFVEKIATKQIEVGLRLNQFLNPYSKSEYKG